MMIVISVFYVVMVFGTTGILNAQKGPEYDSPLDRVGGVLETRTGPMNLRAVGAQILAVPIGMVFLGIRSEEHTSELQSLMRISYAVFCLKKKKNTTTSKSIRDIH